MQRFWQYLWSKPFGGKQFARFLCGRCLWIEPLVVIARLVFYCLYDVGVIGILRNVYAIFCKVEHKE